MGRGGRGYRFPYTAGESNLSGWGFVPENGAVMDRKIFLLYFTFI